MVKVGDYSPWGWIQIATSFKHGITDVSTASHGGFHLDKEARDFMVKYYPKTIHTFLGSWKWYEEDIDSLLVLLAFPDMCGKIYWDKVRLAVIAQKKYFNLSDEWIEGKHLND